MLNRRICRSSSQALGQARARTLADLPARTVIASSLRVLSERARKPGTLNLSTQGAGAVNARDRIGKGPWVNAKGVTIAKDVAELHGTNNLTKQTALSEKGDVTNGRGDTPNKHDILTGSQADGTAFTEGQDRTCNNWTSSTQGAAMVGHADRTGLTEDPPQKSWNSSHPSRGPQGGCSQSDLVSTGGAGLLYCFAVN